MSLSVVMTVLMWCDSEGRTAPVHEHQCNSEQAFDSRTLKKFLSGSPQITLKKGQFLRWLAARVAGQVPQVAQLRSALAHP